jgi:Carboxypeptidase regulatory-like domain
MKKKNRSLLERTVVSSVSLTVIMLFLASASLAALGQRITGGISGTITDSTGAAVPGASITATNVSTGVVTRTSANSAGHYALQSLPVGQYSLTAVQAGFNSAVLSGISLDVDQQVTVDLVMKVGSTSETITVHEATPQVDATSASLGTTVSEEAIQRLPLNLREVGSLALLVPGTVNTTGQSLTSATGNGSGFNDSSYSGAGGGSGSNLLLIDGMLSRALNNAAFALEPWPEMVQEFKIQNNIYDAAFGLTAGTTMNLITSSGTNKLHGAVWEYLRNQAFDARNYFAVTNPEYNRHQFGGSIGGPIVRGKLFYFASYEGLRLKQGQTVSSVVPTMAERSGDFSSFLTGTTANLCASSGAAAPTALNFDTGQLFEPGSEYTYNCPAAPDGSSGPTAVLAGTPVPGNMIGAIDPVAQKVLGLFPAPNSSAAANYVNENPETRQDNEVDGRVDYTLSDRDTLFGRYLIGISNQLFPGNFSPFNQLQHFNGQNVGLGWTHVFSKSLINSVTLGYQRDYLHLSCGSCPRPPGTLGDFGILGLAASSPSVEEYPNVTFTNFATWGDGFPGYFPDVVPDSLEKLGDTLSDVIGRHTLSVGGDIQSWQTNGIEDPVQLNGLVQFNGEFSSLGGEIPNVSGVSDLADMELGYPSGGSYTRNPIVNHLVGGRWFSLFAQDNINVSPNLSVNVGLRWEYRRQPMDKNNQIAAFFPLSNSYTPGDALLLTALPDAANDALCSSAYFISASGQCLVMSSSMRRAKGITGNKIRQVSYGPGHGDFEPRLGISWRPTKSDKLILHLGAGIFDDLPDTNIMGSFANNNPVFTQTPVYNTAFGSPPPVANGTPVTTENMFVNSVAAGLSSITSEFMPSPFYHAPTVYQWSMSVQSQLSQDWALELAYIGNRGVHLDFIHEGTGNQAAPGVGDLQPRRVWPDFNTMYYDSYTREANYNALTAKLTKRVSRGLWALVSYSFAKNLNDNDGDDDGQASFNQNDNNPRPDYGLAGFDVAQTLVVSTTYDLPFGRGMRFLGAGGLTNALVGGWNVNAIVTARGGFPFTVTSSQDYSNSGSSSPRPDRTCSGVGARTVTNWFDQSCFTTAALAQALANGTPRFGNSGRDILMGPGLQEWDVSLDKQTKVKDSMNVDFSAGFFNLFNHPNFSNPNAVLGGAIAGQVTNAAAPRDIQIGLKVAF